LSLKTSIFSSWIFLHNTTKTVNLKTTFRKSNSDVIQTIEKFGHKINNSAITATVKNHLSSSKTLFFANSFSPPHFFSALIFFYPISDILELYPAHIHTE